MKPFTKDNEKSSMSRENRQNTWNWNLSATFIHIKLVLCLHDSWIYNVCSKRSPLSFFFVFTMLQDGVEKIRLIRKPLLVANKWNACSLLLYFTLFSIVGWGGGFMTYLTWTIKMFKITVSYLIMTTIIDTETSDITLMCMLMMVIDLKTKIVKFMAQWSHIQVARFVSKYHIVKKW